MAKPSFCKAGFNGAFLVINVLILVVNFSLVARKGDILLQESETVARSSVTIKIPKKTVNNATRLKAYASGPPGLGSLLEKKQPLPTTANRLQGPSAVWDVDWDNRQVAAVVKGLSRGPLRRLWLIRHGDYHREGTNTGHLTDKGKAQVEKTGKRLKDFGIGFDSFVSSTSVRAKESTEILLKYLPKQKVEWSDLLKEGRPVYPEPGFPQPVPHDKSFEEDGLRLDMAFRKYIHRSDADKKDVTNEIIVTHGNVIGYFALRGLQVPFERWLKLQVIQGSISMLEITSDGHFNVRIMGDMGHIPVGDWTG